MQELLSNTDEIEKSIRAKTEEQHIVSEMIKKCVERNARVAQDQTKYWEEYSSLEQRYKYLAAEVEELRNQRNARVRKGEIIGAFMFELNEREQPIGEFNIRLWSVMVDSVVVKADKTLVYRFRNGTDIEVKI